MTTSDKPPERAGASGRQPVPARRSRSTAAKGPAVPVRRNETGHGISAAEVDKGKRLVVPVVGIGASAGGIEALGRFLGAMPTDSGLAFVVVLHLDPTRESQIASVLAIHTTMPVVDIADGMRIEPNKVYVIVPDRSLEVRGERLRLAKPKEARGHRYPVDILFSSLATDREERTIAVVLSGTGSNGTHGLQEVKANGGLILVQDPETARFDGMPRSAIRAGIADHVLAPERMPDVIQRYIQHGYMAAPGSIESSATGELTALEPILRLVRVRSGQDFRSYKPNTLQRRIHRRMGLGNVQSVAEYVELIRSNPEEINSLTRDLMISVTAFFRDPEAWQVLEETVIAPMLAERKAEAEIRFWVPACATGEEAYSLAMLAVECAEAARKPFDFKIFATDSQEDNLRVARDGIYPHAATMTLPPGRLERFFEKLDSSYRVKKELREIVVFAQQNLLRDPPFSRIDLVTCRNLLIYLEPEAQKQVLALIHFALHQGGHLFLGNAETIGRYDDLFETVSKKWRIYRRHGPTRHDAVEFPMFGTRSRARHLAEQDDPAAPAPQVQVGELARRELLERYAPAAVLVDQKGRALYFHGATGDYLEPPSGEPTRDLVAMAREGMRPRLRSALREAVDAGETITFVARVRQREAVHPVSVTVAPLAAGRSGRDLLLVSFQPAPDPPAGAAPPVQDSAAQLSAEHSLEEELKATRAELQNTIEQMERANEELKASNEEVTSMNEELQSTNEELETSKEELQSFNEELHTINHQLQHKVQELENLTNDQSNLLAGTEIATIFLDEHRRIKWFSPVSRALLDLVPSDIGRPLAHFAPKFTDENLLSDTERVQNELVRIEAEVRSDAGRWYLRRLLPYRTQDNRITGVVLTFTDITERKEAADAVEEERLYCHAIVETLRQPLLVLGGDLRVRSANRAFYTLFGVGPEQTSDKSIYALFGDGPEQTAGKSIHEVGNRQWDPALPALLDRLVGEDHVIDDYVVEQSFEATGRRTMLLNARRLSRGGGRADLILLAIEDITARTQAEAHRDLLIDELGHRVKNVLATVQAIAAQTLRQNASPEAFEKAFIGRLHALAQAHDLLVDEGWAGADIGQLVRRTLEPYRTEGADRIMVEGPGLRLPPRSGVALVMILHELATNAAKYGALSVPEGRLAVNWRLEDRDAGRQVHLLWTETGGPPVVPPLRRGFGTELIERSMAYQLQGKAELEYREEGVRCELTIPDPAEAA